jgi:hypothetical protein
VAFSGSGSISGGFFIPCGKNVANKDFLDILRLKTSALNGSYNTMLVGRIHKLELDIGTPLIA